jgi:hypothetical protein
LELNLKEPETGLVPNSLLKQGINKGSNILQIWGISATM